MRAGVEPGRFQRFAGLGEQMAGRIRHRDLGAAHPAVDVEHPEADALHMERLDGPGECPALVYERRQRGIRSGFERCNDPENPVPGGEAMVGRGHKSKTDE